MRRTHPLIVGGGPSGAASAIVLADAGKHPLLFERTPTAQDVVCGGFLGWDSLNALARLGIDVDALGASRVTTLRLAAGNQTALIALPFAAAGLSRRTLDAALLANAVHHGARVERGVAVRHLDARTHRLRLADGTELMGDAIFLATGKHELRGAARSLDGTSDLPVGMRVRIEPTPAMTRALDGQIELILFDRGYAGLVLQEDGSVNLCFTVARSRLMEENGDRHRLLTRLAEEAPALGERLGQAKHLSQWASVARVPYGWHCPSTTPGLFRLGDQAAVIASLAGDGIAIALASARMATEHFLARGPEGAGPFQRHFDRIAARPLWIAERLRAMAESAGLAPTGVAAMKYFPAAARAATRAVRIGAY